ncbi:MAG TPA: protein kinase [Ktedonobacteraceae bacterium]
MQQSSLEFFCEECGAANSGTVTHCFACQTLLTRSPESLPASVPVIKPVTIVPVSVVQVTANSDYMLPHALTTVPLSDSLAPGTVLQKRYKIESEIGQGGYSIVYKARDTDRYGRAVTIKQINLRNLSSRQVIEATETFNRETTLLPGLKHDGIPKFYGHFTDPEHWYLVMEYIPGQTLEEYLQHSTEQGYCSLADTLRIGIALCSILEYLHQYKPPLVFRDVKPSNIMLTRSKRVYLIDFGIARAFSPGKARDTTPLGSPGYAAPEQYGRGQSDQRTDIYGLGATLQTLLTGCDPLELRQGMPSRAPAPIPPEVQHLLDSMMYSDPRLRPQNLSLVRQKLQFSLARVRRVFRYGIGVSVASIFFIWGGMSALITQNFPVLSPLFTASLCLWGLAAIIGLIFMLIFLTVPAERPIALGMLSVILLVILLFGTHILTLDIFFAPRY